MSWTHSLWLVIVIAAVTVLLRALPFMVFRKHMPSAVAYLSQALPCAIIAMLVVYCLRNTDLLGASHGLAEAVSVLVVVLLHKWRHSTLLSILSGTVCYMLLIRLL